MSRCSLWVKCSCLVAISACSTAPESPLVTYSPGAASANVADYGGSPSSGAGGAAANAGTGGTSSMLPNAGSTSSDSVVPRAGTGAPAAGSGAGSAAQSGSGGVGGNTGVAGAAGSAGTGGAGASALTTLSFDVTTSPVGYRYQPKNIGAIWVQDKNGKLVKSLEVWAAIRRRWLTRYQSELSGASVDVVASATLSNHRAHHVSWNLKDKSGAAVAPGTYTLVVELTDGDQTGRTHAIAFDTSAGATTQTPADAPSFGAMRLTLQ